MSLKTTQGYRKTPKGVLTNMYEHMRRRHAVEFTLSEFHDRFLNDTKFNRLYDEWVGSGYSTQLKPSLDRIDCRKPYTERNTSMITWKENRFKQAALDGKRGRKPAVLQIDGDVVIRRFQSQRHAVKELGIPQGNLSSVLNNRRMFAHGFKFRYENPDLIKP